MEHIHVLNKCSFSNINHSVIVVVLFSFFVVVVGKMLTFIYLFIYFIYIFFYFIFKIYIIVLVFPNIKMNPPPVYMCSPS